MELDQALFIVTQACARMNGTLDEHRSTQEALALIRTTLFPPTSNGSQPEEDHAGTEVS